MCNELCVVDEIDWWTKKSILGLSYALSFLETGRHQLPTDFSQGRCLPLASTVRFNTDWSSPWSSWACVEKTSVKSRHSTAVASSASAKAMWLWRLLGAQKVGLFMLLRENFGWPNGAFIGQSLAMLFLPLDLSQWGLDHAGAVRWGCSRGSLGNVLALCPYLSVRHLQYPQDRLLLFFYHMLCSMCVTLTLWALSTLRVSEFSLFPSCRIRDASFSVHIPSKLQHPQRGMPGPLLGEARCLQCSHTQLSYSRRDCLAGWAGAHWHVESGFSTSAGMSRIVWGSLFCCHSYRMSHLGVKTLAQVRSQDLASPCFGVHPLFLHRN